MAKKSPAPSKTDAVFDYILERIVSGEFAAGDALHIGNLAEANRVSLIPVREALRRLEADGLVKVEHHRGAHVARVSRRDYEEAMELLAILEGSATAQSAEFMTEAEIEEARQHNADMDAAWARGDQNGYNESSTKFHQLLHVHCPNTYLRETLIKGHVKMGAARAAVVGFTTDITKQLSEEHIELLRLISSKAPAEEIENYARGHRLRTMAVMPDLDDA